MTCVSVMCFFFSSRRRHTRFDCDWSSDVCSSDLCPPCKFTRSRIEKCVSLRRSFAVLLHRSEEHTSELQSQSNLVCRLLLEKKNTRHVARSAWADRGPRRVRTARSLQCRAVPFRR